MPPENFNLSSVATEAQQILIFFKIQYAYRIWMSGHCFLRGLDDNPTDRKFNNKEKLRVVGNAEGNVASKCRD